MLSLDLKTGSTAIDSFLGVEQGCAGDYVVNPQIYFAPYDINNSIAFLPYESKALLLQNNDVCFIENNPVTELTKLPSSLRLECIYRPRNSISHPDEEIEEWHLAPHEMSIFLGDSCNLNCSYCNAVPNRKNTYRLHSAKQHLISALENFRSVTDLAFFGNGEPLLYFESIKALVNVARLHGVNSFSVCTNAVLDERTDEIVDYLVENRFSLQISMDGTPEVQNLNRTRNRGGDTHSAVIKTIHSFERYGPISDFAHVRFTMTEQVLGNLRNILDHFSELGFKDVRYADLIPEGNATQVESLDLTTSSSIEEIAEKVVDAMLYADSLGIQFSGDLDPRFPSSDHGCSFMSGDSVAINSEGQLLACLEDVDTWKIGDVVHGNVASVDKDKIIQIRQHRGSLLKDCISCPVKCGGGCTHYSFLSNGNLNTSGDYEGKCDLLRTVLYNYVYRKFKHYENVGEAK